MKANFAKAMVFLMQREGGYQANPADRGNYLNGQLVGTNHGVTAKAWAEYTGKALGPADMKALTVQEISPFYRDRYWTACGCDALPSGVDLAVFDMAVNSGVATAAKTLQSAVGAVSDGKIGPATIAAASQRDSATLVVLYCMRRIMYVTGLDNFKAFGKGWCKRIALVMAQALDMA